MIIIISISILLCAVAIAVGIYAQITDKEIVNNKKEEETEYIDLEENFNEIFTNTINKEITAKQNVNYDEIIYCAYNIQKDEGNYRINAQIPLFKMKNEVTNKANKEIYNTFAKTILDIVENSNVYTIFDLDYVVYANNNIVSLVIQCTYKKGSNPQRKIIQTYNYNIDSNKLMDINELLDYKKLNKQEVEKVIETKIKQEKEEDKVYIEQGYYAFERNENDEIYKIENTPNYFLGKNNYLYLVYAYGNNNYTSELDLVIF